MQRMLKSMAGPGGPGGLGGNPFVGMPMPPPGVGFPFPMLCGYVSVVKICRPMLIFRHLLIWSSVLTIVSSDFRNIQVILLYKYDLGFEHHNHVCVTAFCR